MNRSKDQKNTADIKLVVFGSGGVGKSALVSLK
jgi:GTPase SAR1 family protein